MEKDIKKPESIVIDTNVLMSSLIKQEGYTQALLSILLIQKDIKLAVPESIKFEMNTHIHEIARKSGLPVNVLKEVVDLIFKNVEPVDEGTFVSEIREALSFVSDKSDAPFVGLAIKLKPSIILTYNKRHFDSERLERCGVMVFEPSELARYLDMVIRVNKRVKRKGGILKLISGLYLLKSKGVVR